MRVISIQFGDLREAYKRFEQGLGETYHAQHYSMELTQEIASQCESHLVCCVSSDEDYHEPLTTNIQVVGFKYYLPRARQNWRRLKAVLEEFRPTHIILQTPILQVIKWAFRHDVNVLPLMADSFDMGGIRQRVFNKRFASLLNDDRITVVGNHNVPACKSMARLGIHDSKLIPWDWPHDRRPEEMAPKQAPDMPYRFLYVGAILEDKGIREILDGLAILTQEGLGYHVDFLGSGAEETFAAYAETIGIGDYVTFHGRADRSTVFDMLQKAHVSFVPSRHAYTEGLPLTIYEAFVTRTPLIASDHPMFMSVLEHKKNAMIFQASDASDFADKLRELLGDTVLYETLSMNTAEAWHSIQCPVTYGELVKKWLDATPENIDLLKKAALGASKS